jgi:hypothetical protein
MARPTILHHFYIGSALALAAASFAASAHADPSDRVPEVGFNYDEVETARSAAMGGATRALGNAITGLYSNPANIALTRVYHLQGLAQIWPEAKRQTYGASAFDSVTGRLAGAIGAHYGVLDPDGVDRKWTDIRAAIGFPISERFYAGVTGKYLKLKDNGFPRTGYGLPNSYASAGLSDTPTVDGFTFDAGITVKPSDALFIGVVGSVAAWVTATTTSPPRSTSWPTSPPTSKPTARAAPPCGPWRASNTSQPITFRSGLATGTTPSRRHTPFRRASATSIRSFRSIWRFGEPCRARSRSVR